MKFSLPGTKIYLQSLLGRLVQWHSRLGLDRWESGGRCGIYLAWCRIIFVGVMPKGKLHLRLGKN